MIFILKNTAKFKDLVFHFLIYSILAVIVIETVPPSGIKLDVFTYPSNISFLLCPAFLFYINRRSRTISHIFCMTRLNSNYRMFILRQKYLLIETILFGLPFLFLFILFHNVYQGSRHFSYYMLVFIQFILVFLQIGMISTCIHLLTRNEVLGPMLIMGLIVYDYFAVLGHFFFYFSFFLDPLLSVIDNTNNTILNIHTVGITIVRCIFIFILGVVLFNEKFTYKTSDIL